MVKGASYEEGAGSVPCSYMRWLTATASQLQEDLVPLASTIPAFCFIYAQTYIHNLKILKEQPNNLSQKT